ncbi:MAG: flagellar biosynthesis protein FlhF, partial [Pseudomonadota bacterium]
MNVKKFTAPTSREALRKVREALGPDAVILSNRQADGIVEILALANDDAASLAMPSPHSPMAQPRPQPDMAAASSYGAQQLSAPPSAMPAQPRRAAQPQAAAAPAGPAAGALDLARISELVAAAVAGAKQSAAAEMSGMMSEIRAMRGMMETQLAEIAWGSTQQREPQKAAVLREMLAAGFSASLARYLIDKLPAGRDAAESMRWIRTVLTRNISAMRDEDALIDQGGVFALVGPTGVGKTTSTAKLAARCVMRHGPDKLALITTD